MLKKFNNCDFVFFVAPVTPQNVLVSHTVNWLKSKELAKETLPYDIHMYTYIYTEGERDIDIAL